MESLSQAPTHLCSDAYLAHRTTALHARTWWSQPWDISQYVSLDFVAEEVIISHHSLDLKSVTVHILNHQKLSFSSKIETSCWFQRIA